MLMSVKKPLHLMVNGNLTRAVYEAFATVVERKINENGKIRILLEMGIFQGGATGALWDDLKLEFKRWNNVERLAIVGELKWQEGMAAFGERFTAAKVRYFADSKLDEAKSWLAEESTTNG